MTKTTLCGNCCCLKAQFEKLLILERMYESSVNIPATIDQQALRNGHCELLPLLKQRILWLTGTRRVGCNMTVTSYTIIYIVNLSIFHHSDFLHSTTSLHYVHMVSCCPLAASSSGFFHSHFKLTEALCNCLKLIVKKN